MSAIVVIVVRRVLASFRRFRFLTKVYFRALQLSGWSTSWRWQVAREWHGFWMDGLPMGSMGEACIPCVQLESNYLYHGALGSIKITFSPPPNLGLIHPFRLVFDARSPRESSECPRGLDVNSLRGTKGSCCSW